MRHEQRANGLALWGATGRGMNGQGGQRFRIYGSSLVSLWDCPRCFWRRYRLGERRPFARTDETAEIADEAMVGSCGRPSGWTSGAGYETVSLAVTR